MKTMLRQKVKLQEESLKPMSEQEHNLFRKNQQESFDAELALYALCNRVLESDNEETTRSKMCR